MGDEKETFIKVQATESSPPPNEAVHHPHHQERPPWLRIILLIIDIGLALSPLLFLGIAVAAIAYNHRLVDDDPVLQKNITVSIKQYSYQTDFSYTLGGQAVIETAQIAVSIFPILFAAVVGRFMKSYALHRAERGSTMGVLEQLYGSQNLSNSVQLLFALRGPGLLGVAVVFIWILSPIGGQGVKRVLGTRNSVIDKPVTVYYCNTSSSESQFGAERLYGTAHPALNDAFGSLLFTDSVSGNSDVWGNVKIPYLNNDQANNSTWMDAMDGVTYSSMAGLLVSNLPNDTVTSFNMTTSYVGMICQDAKTFDYSPPENSYYADAPKNMTGYQDFLNWAGALLYNTNMTNETDSVNNTSGNSYGLAYDGWQYIVDVKVHTNSSGISTWSQPPLFMFATQEVDGVSYVDNSTHNRIYAYECTPSVQWLEAYLQCYQDEPCAVIQTRPTSQPASLHESPIFAAPAADAHESSTLYYILDFINSRDSLATSGISYSGPQPILEKYIAGAGTYATQDATTNVDFSNVTGSDVAPSLGIVINTVWLLGVQYLSLAKPAITNVTQLLASDPNAPEYTYNSEVFANYIGYDVSSAPAVKSTTYTIYQVNWTWVIIAIVISLLLLFLGLLGLYFRHTNKHPDVLGFVSTLTRDNPNFEPPPQAEKLDGMEMANYYKHTKVQLVNTAEEDEQARITLRKFQRSPGDL